MIPPSTYRGWTQSFASPSPGELESHVISIPSFTKPTFIFSSFHLRLIHYFSQLLSFPSHHHTLAFIPLHSKLTSVANLSEHSCLALELLNCFIYQRRAVACTKTSWRRCHSLLSFPMRPCKYVDMRSPAHLPQAMFTKKQLLTFPAMYYRREMFVT